MDYLKCARFVKEKHKGQMRDQGISYFYHPLAVAQILRKKGFNLEYQITGLFHDLLEDTDALEEEILQLSNENVLKAVKLLTKTDEISTEEYLNGIKHNHMATIVKLADRLHNLQTLSFRPTSKIKPKLDETILYFESLAKNTPFEEEFSNILAIKKQSKNSLQRNNVYKLQRK